MKTRTFLILAVATAMLLTSALGPSGFSQPVEQRRREAESDIQRLHEKLEDAVEKYKYACCRLEETRGLIEENKAELERAEAELSRNKNRLNNRARAMYMSRPQEFIDVLVNAGSFDEFLVGLDLVKKVGNKDAQLVKDVKIAKAKLERARAELKQREAEQAAAKREMAESKSAIERELSSARGRLAGIEEEIRQAMARRAAESAAATTTTSAARRRSYPDPVAVRTRPPGAPNTGVVGVAYDQLGKPYVWGTAGPNTFDCSGLTKYCYRVGAGINISHSSYAQAYCGTPVGVSELQPGDIVGFRGWGHVGLYIGGGQYIHAPRSGDVVKISSLSARRDFCGAVRP